MKSNRNELILSQSQNQFVNNNNNMNINNMNDLQFNKNNNYQNNNHININHLNNEKHTSEENDYSSKNRDTAINMNTNTNNTNTNNEENANQTQGENNICESSTNINLNNNLTLEDYACIGSGYTKYSKYDISSYDLSEIIEDSHPIRTSCFSPKGDCLAIGTNSKCLKIYSLSHVLSDFKKYIKITSKTKMPLIFEQKNHHMGSIYCLDWSVSGRLLASGSNDKVIKLMVVPELSESSNTKKNEEDDDILELPIEGHNGTVRSLCFDPSSDLTLLTSGDLDKNIKMWDTENGSSIGELVGHTNDVTCIKWSNDGNYFGSGSADKTIKLWDLKSLREICSVPTLGYGSINDISLLNTGEMLIVAAAHVDGKITIWDAQRKSLFTEIKENTQQKEVRGLAFSPDGKFLVSGGFDNKVKIYDIMNNFNLAGELVHNDKVVSVKWHPDLPILVSTSADKTARLWSPTNY
jgi:WD40 repeat protein